MIRKFDTALLIVGYKCSVSVHDVKITQKSDYQFYPHKRIENILLLYKILKQFLPYDVYAIYDFKPPNKNNIAKVQNNKIFDTLIT